MRTVTRLVAAVGLLVGSVPLVVGGAAPPAAADVTGMGHTTCTSAGVGTTCAGTFGGDNAWDPTTGKANNQLPTVTVAQSSNLTYQTVHLSWTNFTPSNASYYKVGVYECRGAVDADSDVVPTAAPDLSWKDPSVGSTTTSDAYQKQGSCYAADSDANSWSGAANGRIVPTGSDGTGQLDVPVETKSENGWLGCDDNHPCWLVVVPNWGGAQPVSGTGVDCTDHGHDTKSDFTNPNKWADTGYIANSCSWADRIMVPVGFSRTASECPDRDAVYSAEGSPLLARAMSQWQVGLCQGSDGVSFSYDGNIDEYQARQAFLSGGSLTSSLGMAMVSRPPDAAATEASSRKLTYAPLANSAIAIAYYVDNPTTKQPITDLKLDARLVAKLLTQSYALDLGSCDAQQTPSKTCDPAVNGNPATIFTDPEFRALNPQYDSVNFNLDDNVQAGGFLPLVVSGNSDLVYELTRWVESDPDAAAFLDGQPDPWGMRVNTNYRALSYPLDQFQAQDPGATIEPTCDDCSEEQTMQSTWFPISGMSNVASKLVSNQTTATNRNAACTLGVPSLCVDAHAGWSYLPLNSESVGQRALFAVVPESDAAAFAFPTAQLENAAGQYVSPSTASMSAGIADYKTNPDKITQYANFDSTDPKNYPLTMTSYAMVPTCGLANSEAHAIAATLTDVAGDGQVYGTDPGELAPGYLALTSAQRKQAQQAATDVGTQSCTSPPPDTTVSGRHDSDVPGSGGPDAAPAGGVNAPSAAPNKGSGPAAGSPSPSPSTAAAEGVPTADTAGWTRIVLPVLLGLGAALGLGGLLVYGVGRAGGWAACWQRVRELPGSVLDRLGVAGRGAP